MENDQEPNDHKTADQPVAETDDAERQSAENTEENTPENNEKPDGQPEKSDTASLAGEPVIMHEGRIRRLMHAYWSRKRVTLPATVLIVIALLTAIPFTRYALAALIVSQDYSIVVVDAKTNNPVSNALVSLRGKSAKTDNKGLATLHVKVGSAKLTVTKKYYVSHGEDIVVPITNSSATHEVKLAARGRQVPVTVVDKISGKPVENALVRAASTEAKTDKKGVAIIVLPADKATLKATISANAYNDTDATITVTDKTVKQNELTITPAGKVYFLSKLSGKIDVVKTNLDGTGRQTVLAGTGNEDPYNTVLLASRDWQYLALLAKRDNNPAKLYLLNTSNDKLTEIDSGNATFTLVGWSGNSFVYVVNRNNVPAWQPNSQALKSYRADTDQLKVLDQTKGEGTSLSDYAQTSFGTVYEVGKEIIYAQNYIGNSGRLAGKSVLLTSIQDDGSNKKTIKSFPIPSSFTYGYSVDLAPYDAQSLYVQAYDASNNPVYYEYEDGKLASKPSITNDQFYRSYPTYLLSPSGSNTFWGDARDGKNTLFVGDANGQNGKQIAQLSSYTPYGWFTDDYLLISKDSSELSIMPVTGGTAIKISDYHKPQYSYRGYGGGYGGL